MQDTKKVPSLAVFTTVLVVIMIVGLVVIVQPGPLPLHAQALVGLTLAAGFGYGSVERLRRLRPILQTGEVLLSCQSARLCGGMAWVQGRLTLTNRRLVFKPLWPGPVIEITRGRGVHARVTPEQHLWVRAGRREYCFAVDDPAFWAGEACGAPDC